MADKTVLPLLSSMEALAVTASLFMVVFFKFDEKEVRRVGIIFENLISHDDLKR